MTFEEFKERACFYVLGALEGAEVEEIERARKELGQKGEDFLAECYALYEGFALSLRPAGSSEALQERLMLMVRERKRKKERSRFAAPERDVARPFFRGITS
jgi:hypothetical protein